MKKWTFRAGIRHVTVDASNRLEAERKARAELDKRCIRAGQEPPVGWTITLKEPASAEGRG